MVTLWKLFSNLWPKQDLAPVPKPSFCYWCHRDNCPHPTFEACKNHRFQCEYHPEVKDGSAPSFCHRCCYGFETLDKWVKPTLYKPDPSRYDSRWCLDWICEGCFKRDEDRKDLEKRQYNNTREAAELTFTQEDGVFLYYGEPIEADFPISYESLAPYVIKIIDAAHEFLYNGIDFDTVVIRDGCVYIRYERQEWGGNV